MAEAVHTGLFSTGCVAEALSKISCNWLADPHEGFRQTEDLSTGYQRRETVALLAGSFFLRANEKFCSQVPAEGWQKLFSHAPTEG